MVAAAGRQARREHGNVRIAIAGAAAIALIAVTFVTVDLLTNLHMMNQTLGSVATRMTALDPMSRKLDRLAGMQGQLSTLDRHLREMNATMQSMDAKLSATNARLASTQQHLGSMDAKLALMTTEMKMLDRDLASMRGDIHTMAHKISGSFLFRAVK
jgi:septal ring factor EnvC (AmiA/AmiB activator)